MITNLDDLTRALITIIFDYRKNHRSKHEEPMESEDSIADNDLCIIMSPTQNLAQKGSGTLQPMLKQFIDGATHNDPTRLSLLKYLLHIVILLKQRAEKTNPEITDDVLKQLLFEFLKHLKQLCYVLKRDDSISVQINIDTLSIQGLVSTNSTLAQLIHHCILKPLQIEKNTEDCALNASINEWIKPEFIDTPQAPEATNEDIQPLAQSTSNAQLSMFAKKSSPIPATNAHTPKEINHHRIHPLQWNPFLLAATCIYQGARNFMNPFENDEERDETYSP